MKDIFSAWLEAHVPTKKDRVLSRVRALRGGRLNASAWGARMRGEGIFAEQIHDLFAAAARRAGLNREPLASSTDQFRRPGGEQLNLF